ncbi:hypothetical protein [Sphingomonas tagetis]|nr:hypothetical protein [Sphingomonas tagetis]
MTAEVRHWLPPTRDIHGRQASTGSTAHRARVLNTPGSIISSALRERMGDASAVIWLLNHPRMIAIGDTFELPAGETLKVIRAERRTSGPDTLSKVYLS